MNQKLIDAFNRQMQFTQDKSHAAGCAIFEVVFKGRDDLWNAPQDEAWKKKYNRALLALADAGLVTLWPK